MVWTREERSAVLIGRSENRVCGLIPTERTLILVVCRCVCRGGTPIRCDQPLSDRHVRTLLRLIPTFSLALCAALLVAGCSSTQPPPANSGDSAQLERLQRENEALRQDLIDARKRASSGVLHRGETIEVLSTDLYFESGSAQLTSEGVEKLKGIAARLKRDYPERTIRVEGYTDDTPIGDKLKDKFPSNWELSAARAAAVVRHLQWTHDIDPKRFEVVGFGPYQPLASNETAEGRQENRRVRIAVLPDPEPPAMEPSTSRSGQGREGF